MAARKTVNVNCEKLLTLMRKNEWSNAAFSRRVGKYSTWFGEVLRGKNLPSPEEAARMCLLLNTTPEEILLSRGDTEEETAKLQADIELVEELIEQEREKQSIKKDLPRVGEVEFVGVKREIMDTMADFSPEELALALARVRGIKESRG